MYGETREAYAAEQTDRARLALMAQRAEAEAYDRFERSILDAGDALDRFGEAHNDLFPQQQQSPPIAREQEAPTVDGPPFARERDREAWEREHADERSARVREA